MRALAPGATAPPIAGHDFAAGATALFFYKVTCPVCQMAAPVMDHLDRAYPDRILGIGQDPGEKLALFGSEYGMTIPWIPDLPPYELSNAYRVRVVPTTFLIGEDGIVASSVESWDRDGLNALARSLAELTGASYVAASGPGDGLPPFRPG